MQRIFFLSARILALCFLIFFVFSAPAYARHAAPLWPHEKSDLTPDPALLFGRLDNGFGYVLMKNTEPKSRVSIKLAVLTGSLHERDDQRGLAHYLEHMAFNGSAHFPPGELIKYFQSIGMRFGNDVNAQTGFDSTIYQLLLPEGKKEHLDKGLTVMADYAGSLFLLPEEIEKERGVILSEKQARDSVGYRTFKESLKFFADNARVAFRLPIGTEEVIKAANQENIRDFYETWYRPDNMVLVMVGDFDPQTADLIIKEKFSGLAPKTEKVTAPGPGKVVHKGLKTFYHYEKEAGNTDLSIETLQTIEYEPDNFKIQARRLLEAMANKIVKHRLDALKEGPDCPFTEAGISSGIFLKTYEFSSITATCNPENWDKSLVLIEKELRRAIKYGFTNAEVLRVKKEYTAKLENAVAKANTRNSGSMARLIAKNIISGEVFLSPAQEQELFEPVVSRASARKLRKAFARTWPGKHRLVSVTGNAKVGEKEKSPESLIASVYEKSVKTKVRKPLKIKTAAFPYLPKPENPGQIVSKIEIKDLGIIQVIFENKVTLNIKKTDFKDSEIVASLRLGAGRSDEPKDRPGLSILAPAVINESGLGAMTRDELKRAMAGKSTSVSMSVGEDAVYFKGSTIPKELPLFFQLLHARLVDPGFRQDAFDRSMKRFGQMYQSLEHTVEGAIKLHATPFLAGGDTRFGNPPKKVFDSLTLEHVISWAGPVLAKEPLELSIVGDLDVDQTIKLAAMYLGSLGSRKNIGESRDRAINFPKGQSSIFKVETEIKKAVALVVYPTTDIWDISRTRRLNMLAEVFTDRLRKDIRENQGLTYSPSAWNHSYRAYPGYGYITAYLTVDPTTAELVGGLVREIAKDMVMRGIDEKELQRAIEPTVTNIKDMLRKNSYWLNTVLSGSTLHPQQIEWRRTILEDYSSITASEISAFARQYLVDKNVVVIIIVSK